MFVETAESSLERRERLMFDVLTARSECERRARAAQLFLDLQALPAVVGDDGKRLGFSDDLLPLAIALSRWLGETEFLES